jgi:hypothetical protein
VTGRRAENGGGPTAWQRTWGQNGVSGGVGAHSGATLVAKTELAATAGSTAMGGGA